MVFATWVIAGLALLQYRLTAETAQKQLRPYLTVRKGCIHDLGPGECARIEVLMKNYGQTPALQLRLTWAIQYRPNVGDVLIDIAGQRSLGLLAPNAEYRLNLVVSKPFTDQHLASLCDGHAGLFVSGRIDYLDSFGRSQWTDFRMVYNQHSVPSDELSFCEDGNEAS